MNTQSISTVTADIVLLSWFIFALLFVFRKRETKTTKTKRDPASLLGVTIFAIGYAIVWSARRPETTPFYENTILNTTCSVIAILISIGSIGIILSALRILGKQWNVEATLVQDHQLITTGVYSIVRNPIYTGMLGMMIATGIAFSYPFPLLFALLLGWVGTVIRIQKEEKLLRSAFGELFDQYHAKVPSLFPKLFSRK